MKKGNWLKKLMSTMIAGAMVLSLLPAGVFAEGGNALDSTATTADPAGPGYVLTLSGLEAGDTAKYYKIIEQDVDTVDSSGNVTRVGTQQWKLTAAVDKNKDGVVDGTENADFGHKTVTYAADGRKTETAVNGLYVDEMVVNDFETTEDGTKVDKTKTDTRVLTSAMVNAIATAITNNKAAGTDTAAAADADGVIQATGVTDAGMYMFVAVPASTNLEYIYKPIFVSYDYYNTVSEPEDDTHKIDLEKKYDDTAGKADYADDAGVFKKSPLSVDKKSGVYDDNGNVVDLQNDVAVGDTVNFTITVPVPTYTRNYVAPMFYVTDDLTEGLKLVADSIEVSVKNGDTTVDTSENTDYRIFTRVCDAETGAATLAPEGNTDYYDFKNTQPADSTFDGFVVQFLDDFLYTALTAPVATITYQAVVTETAKQKFAQQVNQMDNTAKLNFSKDPNYIPDGYFDEEGNPNDDFDPNDPDTKDPSGNKEPTGELKDRTRHYTFDIDADVLGRDQSQDTTTGPDGSEVPLEESEHDKTSEIRKIFVDANGKVIQKKTSGLVKKGGEEQGGNDSTMEGDDYGWLEGAEFTLTKTKSHTAVEPGTGRFTELETPVAMKFDADTHILSPDGENPKSDAKGYIAMKGLDAGVYVLKEIKAPLGFAFNPNVQFEITITPTYVMEPAAPDDTMINGTGGADDLILESYEVKIVTQQLDDHLNIVGEQKVTTISTYNMKKGEDGKPESLLKDDGTSNVAGDGATGGVDVLVESFGSNETAMIVNKRLGFLPATGGSGLYFYLILGAAVAAFFGFMIRKIRKAGMNA